LLFLPWFIIFFSGFSCECFIFLCFAVLCATFPFL
jgi:hypothetical protein